MDPQKKEELAGQAVLGGDVRDFLRGPGYAVIDRFVSDKVQSGYKAWLKCKDPAEREAMWQKAQAYSEFENHLKRIMIEGDLAAATLHKEITEEI